MKLELYLTPYTKGTSKSVKDPNGRAKTIKPSRNHSGKSSCYGFNIRFLDMIPKA
jgi:hypothetical protein